jgi:transcriptional regulator with XRE-family HTH domain
VSPVVRHRRLVHELRRLREAAHLTIEEVATALEVSASKISRIETGRVLVSPRDVRDLLRIYGVPDDERDALIQLARDLRRKGWWHAYADGVRPRVATYLDLESTASALWCYQVSRIPALLLTKDYTRAYVTLARIWPERAIEPDETTRLVMESQRQAAARSLKLWVVTDESAIRRRVGGREVMRMQIEHMIEVSSRPNVLIQVMPFNASLRVAFDTSFTIMAFPESADPRVVSIGYPTGMLLIEDLTEVDQYITLFRHMQAAALSPNDSVALMLSMLREL